MCCKTLVLGLACQTRTLYLPVYPPFLFYFFLSLNCCSDLKALPKFSTRYDSANIFGWEVKQSCQTYNSVPFFLIFFLRGNKLGLFLKQAQSHVARVRCIFAPSFRFLRHFQRQQQVTILTRSEERTDVAYSMCVDLCNE